MGSAQSGRNHRAESGPANVDATALKHRSIKTNSAAKNCPFLPTFFKRDSCIFVGYFTLNEKPRPLSWLIVLGGSMAVSPPVTALPWYDRRDYPALLKLFSDPHMLPAAYDAWLNRTEQTESQLQKAGFAVARIWIRPVPFAAWCRERNVSLDQWARLTFVNEAARRLSARQ
jgi:hypothetical protein